MILQISCLLVNTFSLIQFHLSLAVSLNLAIFRYFLNLTLSPATQILGREWPPWVITGDSAWFPQSSTKDRMLRQLILH